MLIMAITISHVADADSPGVSSPSAETGKTGGRACSRSLTPDWYPARA
jgi:hypothetical protein